MNRNLVFVATLCISAFLLTGCGSSSSNTSNSTIGQPIISDVSNTSNPQEPNSVTDDSIIDECYADPYYKIYYDLLITQESKAISTILDNYLDSEYRLLNAGYNLENLDEDNVPELFLYFGTSHSDPVYIFTLSEDQTEAIFLGAYGENTGKLDIVENKNIVISEHGNQGYFMHVFSSISDGILKVTLSDGSKSDVIYYSDIPFTSSSGQIISSKDFSRCSVEEYISKDKSSYTVGTKESVIPDEYANCNIITVGYGNQINYFIPQSSE